MVNLNLIDVAPSGEYQREKRSNTVRKVGIFALCSVIAAAGLWGLTSLNTELGTRKNLEQEIAQVENLSSKVSNYHELTNATAKANEVYAKVKDYQANSDFFPLSETYVMKARVMAGTHRSK